jgi:ubiquinone/menaquinone biosynthesis C-methylase UbiE
MTAHDVAPPYSRYLVRLIRPFPDFDFAFIKPLRAKAVALLELSPGNRALDLGCGAGASFPYLRDGVGPSGEVVGVEISHETTINARRRIARHGWTNVQVIVASAQTVTLSGQFDAALMFGAPDVYASTEALANILPHLRPGARLAFFGAKTSRRRMGWLLNTVFRTLVPKLSFRTTPAPDDEPWRVIAAHVDRVTVEEYFFGWMFIASGSLKRDHAT